MKKDLKKYLAEFIGTAVLVFAGCGTAVFTNVNIVATALAFGLAVVAMAYTIGPISGCHINPAVSLGALISRKISLKIFCFYVLAQMFGGILGGALLFGLVKLVGFDSVGHMGANGFVDLSETFGITTGTAAAVISTILTEIILTFIFIFTIIGVTSKKDNKLMAGLEIGLCLVLVHLVGIGLTGTSVNPARSFGVAIFGGIDALKEVWVFLVAPLIGAALAGVAGYFMFKNEDDTIVQPETKQVEK